ncbi:MAG: hypothetical protein ACRD0N_12795 [Acidimicrobiales bacterium]
MRFRVGFVIGFGTGYYLGSMAGRERFEQINSAVRKVKRSGAYETATEKARGAVELGVDKASHLVDSVRGNGNGDDSAGTDPYLQPGTPYPSAAAGPYSSSR